MLQPFTKNDVDKFLKYDPSTGIITWRIYRPGRFCIKEGSTAGTVRTEVGYIYIGVLGHRCLAHRLAWLMYYGKWPEKDIDHINGERTDNRITNLRLAEKWQNLANCKIRRHNVCGFKGVFKQGERWVARLIKHRTKYYLGTFNSPEEAHAAYCRAAEYHFGEFARSG